ncbi:MAG: DUF1549 and DUF1553 domain-containing protein, partial [Aureliella sp.]
MMRILWGSVLVCTALAGGFLLAEAPHEANSQQVLEQELTASDREHWAWLPLVQPEVPGVRDVNQSWGTNAIDRFVLAQLEQRELAPSTEANRTTLLRRIKFDLHGLPPSVEEIDNFLSDESPEAYAHLVDRMLASPAYGERWAQYWLDLARFAETDGFEHDLVREDAWKFRDWIVSALNSDMPYDDFVLCQLAGDGAPENEIATMFCMAGPDMPDINEQDQRRHDKLNEITSTVGAVFLSMQMQCAQCHDHKYDPISQADFFRLRAVFESAIPPMKRDRPVLVLQEQLAPLPARFYRRGELHQPGPIVQPGVPRIAVAAGKPIYCRGNSARRAFVSWLFAADNPLTARVIANRIWQHHFGMSFCGNPSDFGVVAAEPSHPELLDWLAWNLRESGWSMKALHRTILNSATYRQAGVQRLGDSFDTRVPVGTSSDLYG